MLSPVLYAFGERYLTDNAQMPPTYWRSSPPGIDLLAYVMPNPNHPLWGAPMRDTIIAWSGRGDGFPEYVGALLVGGAGRDRLRVLASGGCGSPAFACR